MERRLVQILNALSKLEHVVLETMRSANRIDGKMDALSQRVDRIEDREHGRHNVSIKDLAPLLPGLLALALVALGKITAHDAQQLIGSGH